MVVTSEALKYWNRMNGWTRQMDSSFTNTTGWYRNNDLHISLQKRLHVHFTTNLHSVLFVLYEVTARRRLMGHGYADDKQVYIGRITRIWEQMAPKGKQEGARPTVTITTFSC